MNTQLALWLADGSLGEPISNYRLLWRFRVCWRGSQTNQSGAIMTAVGSDWCWLLPEIRIGPKAAIYYESFTWVHDGFSYYYYYYFLTVSSKTMKLLVSRFFLTLYLTCTTWLHLDITRHTTRDIMASLWNPDNTIKLQPLALKPPSISSSISLMLIQPANVFIVCLIKLRL